MHIMSGAAALTDNIQGDPLYLLKWFALAGPQFRMPVSAEFYSRAQDKLLALAIES
jgi:hypothetical protein